MKRLGWMILQLAVFGGLFYLLRIRFIAVGNSPDDASTAAMAISFILTLIIFGAINLIQNWLIRRRGRIARCVDLGQEPDHGRDRLRRARPMIEELPEIPEIALREKPRKLLRPPP